MVLTKDEKEVFDDICGWCVENFSSGLVVRDKEDGQTYVVCGLNINQDDDYYSYAKAIEFNLDEEMKEAELTEEEFDSLHFWRITNQDLDNVEILGRLQGFKLETTYKLSL